VKLTEIASVLGDGTSSLETRLNMSLLSRLVDPSTQLGQMLATDRTVVQIAHVAPHRGTGRNQIRTPRGREMRVVAIAIAVTTATARFSVFVLGDVAGLLPPRSSQLGMARVARPVGPCRGRSSVPRLEHARLEYDVGELEPVLVRRTARAHDETAPPTVVFAHEKVEAPTAPATLAGGVVGFPCRHDAARRRPRAVGDWDRHGVRVDVGRGFVCGHAELGRQLELRRQVVDQLGGRRWTARSAKVFVERSGDASRPV
jgi:hypothetical protein